MDSKRFIDEVESRLTALSPDMVPGVLKKQLENLDAESDSLTPSQAKEFIQNVFDALNLVLGPEGSNGAKKLMMRKFRQCCTNEELEELMMA
jgi:hypothetical protein